jgi:hypothetical protein
MATLALAFPVLPGKGDEARRFAQEVMARRDEAAASWGRMGLTRETWHLQSTPMGDLVLVWMEGDDPVEGMRRWAQSTDPYDRWFKDTAGAITGLDFNRPVPQYPEALLDWPGR